MLGVLGGLAVVFTVAIFVAYRNYRYEQELDLLLWKVDPKELKVKIGEKSQLWHLFRHQIWHLLHCLKFCSTSHFCIGFLIVLPNNFA